MFSSVRRLVANISFFSTYSSYFYEHHRVMISYNIASVQVGLVVVLSLSHPPGATIKLKLPRLQPFNGGDRFAAGGIGSRPCENGPHCGQRIFSNGGNRGRYKRKLREKRSVRCRWSVDVTAAFACCDPRRR